MTDQSNRALESQMLTTMPSYYASDAEKGRWFNCWFFGLQEALSTPQGDGIVDPLGHHILALNNLGYKTELMVKLEKQRTENGTGVQETVAGRGKVEDETPDMPSDEDLYEMAGIGPDPKPAVDVERIKREAIHHVMPPTRTIFPMAATGISEAIDHLAARGYFRGVPED